MSIRARAARLVALSAAGALLAGCSFDSAYDLPLPGGADVGENPTTVTIEFRDVLNLVPKSAVKVDDVTVGKVTNIEMEDWSAVVTVKVRDSVDLPSNATASIRQTSILGEKFVSLEEPAEPKSGELDSGDTIPLERTGRNPEIEEVLGALSMVLNGGGVAQLQTITREMNRVFDGREDDIKSLLRRLNKFMGDVDRQKPELVAALRKIDRLGRNANDQTDAIKAALDEVPEAVRVLNDQRDEFVRMLDKLDRFSNVGTRVIRQSKENTLANLRDLQPILRNLNQSGTSLVRSLRLLPTAPYPDSLVGKTPAQARNYQKGSFINARLTFNPDIQAILDDMSPAEYKRMVGILNGGVRKSDAPTKQRRLQEFGNGLSRLMLDDGSTGR